MSTQKAKFELFTRLQSLGFTYEEAAQLRRIEMTLHRWAEEECNGTIQRNEVSGLPCRCYGADFSLRFLIADRERGALRRLGRIVGNRNTRNWVANGGTCISEMPSTVLPYHQRDPRGCALYLVTREQLMSHDGQLLPINQYYTRGLAVRC